MIEHFHNINEDQFKTLTKTIARITILIGGADGNLDKEEKNWAEKLAKIRTYANEDTLHGFYREVGRDFTEVLEEELEILPGLVEDRANILIERIAEVNAILPLLPREVAKELYKSYISFAKHVAKASGGFFDFWSINTAEDKWLDLDMIKQP